MWDIIQIHLEQYLKSWVTVRTIIWWTDYELIVENIVKFLLKSLHFSNILTVWFTIDCVGLKKQNYQNCLYLKSHGSYSDFPWAVHNSPFVCVCVCGHINGWKISLHTPTQDQTTLTQMHGNTVCAAFTLCSSQTLTFFTAEQFSTDTHRQTHTYADMYFPSLSVSCFFWKSLGTIQVLLLKKVILAKRASY